MNPRRLLACSVVVASVSSPTSNATADDWVLAGMVLTPSGIISDGAISIADKVISAVGPRSSIPGGSAAINVPGIILPGFIDLHDHLTWNMLPRWLPGRKFNSRYEWQDTAEYDRVLSTPHAQMLKVASCEAEIYAEVKALVGGATSVVGGLLKDPKFPENEKCVTGLARNLDTDSGFPPPSPGVSCPTDPDTDRTLIDVVDNEVFPLEIPHGRLAYILCELAAGTLRGLVIHLSEGAANDSNAHREFNMISREILLKTDGKTSVPRDGLAIIHGSALRDQDFLGMSSSNVGLIWSPRSNDELYGSTTNIAAARLAKVPIAIAPDWSPSGSAGVLQEIAYAARHYKVGSDDLIAMATSVPAKMVRISDYVGSLEPNKFADLIVINAKVDPKSAKPLDPVVAATPADVVLVVVAGQPLYGDKALLRQLLPPMAAIDDITVCGAKKGIYLGQSNAPALDEHWKDIKHILRKALNRAGSDLSEIECD